MGDGALDGRTAFAAPGAVPSASQRVAGQAMWSILAKVATLAGTLGVSVLAARLLGKDTFGVWSLARNLGALGVLLVSAGLDRALLRFVPELEAQGARGGARRLVRTVLLLQCALWAAASALLLLLAPLFERLFTPALLPLLPMVCLFAAAFAFKETLYQIHFALARARILAMATTVTGLGWLGITALWLRAGGGAGAVLAAQAVALLAAVAILLPSLRRELAAIPQRSDAAIAPRRLAAYAGSQLGSSLVNLVVQRQSEIYFLAAVTSPAVVGFYDLAYSLPQLGLELVPLSLYAVVLAAMTSTVHRDPSRLASLVGWYYKLLAVVTLPVAFLGAAWADRAVVLLYGAEMAPAGDLAQVFAIVHLLPFVSLPVGAALNVLERSHRTLRFGVAQIGVTLALDFLLIPRFKVAGAVAAVVLSFLLVTPLTLRYALRQTGPLEFPWRWILRLAAGLGLGLLPALARPWLNGGWGLVIGLGAALPLMLLGVRISGVLGTEERYRLRTTNFPGRRWALLLLGVER
ncbi:MAG: oligosaccharide flippase family protein [Thermoanaerobaculia bacterium]|nr:oligosaccharide flippase family protein [Thermoanaerobaculia bacterium]MBP9823679.1 oligosaccharide flippase family protein [Thermoanaerobaculia bacterium]